MAQRKKKKLQTYEHHLKSFEYKQALTSALATKNPEVVVALIEELIERNGLFVALASRSELELCTLLEFLTWKISDYRFSNVLVDVARIVLNMYAGIIGLSDKVDYRLFKDLEKEVRQQVELQKGLLELSGQIDMITRVASLN
jgi:U3 small nucleolar RNA-associated protein 15